MGSARTLLLFAAMFALFALVGWGVGALFFGEPGPAMFAFLAFAALFNLASWWASDRLVLWSYRARIVEPHEAPRLHRLVDDLCRRADLPKPRVAIVPEAAPNAFATGRSRKHAVVAVTEGLLRLLPDDELRGVLAHELGHVRNRDILVMSAAATIGGAIAFAARWAMWGSLFGDDDGGSIAGAILLAVTAPIAALLVQLAISRAREYKADAAGAAIAGDPLSLARALRRLEAAARGVPLHANPAHSHLFIVNPLRGGWVAGLFATHPPMDERVRRLERLL